MSSGKLILLLIAMGMVGLVLLLGYKLDKYEEKGKRKEKINKKRENKEDDNSYSGFESLKSDYEEMGETTSFGTSSFDFNKDISKNDKYTEEFDKTAVIEKIDLSKLEIAEEDASYEKIYEESEYDSNLEELEEEIYETNDEYDYENSNDSTMVFDTASVNEELDVIGNVKGYDFDEDDIEKSKKEVEKPKVARKTAAKKTTAKKSTTKKTETKPKATKKTTTKKAEEKPKTAKKTTAKKTTTKKSTTKKAEEKPKVARKTTTKKTEEKPKAVRKTTTKTATTKTTKKAVKSTKTNAKK